MAEIDHTEKEQYLEAVEVESVGFGSVAADQYCALLLVVTVATEGTCLSWTPSRRFVKLEGSLLVETSRLWMSLLFPWIAYS